MNVAIEVKAYKGSDLGSYCGFLQPGTTITFMMQWINYYGEQDKEACTRHCSGMGKTYNKTIKAQFLRVTPDLFVLGWGLVAKNSALGLRPFALFLAIRPQPHSTATSYGQIQCYTRNHAHIHYNIYTITYPAKQIYGKCEITYNH